MAVILEARAAARLRLVGVHREGLVVAAARMRDVIDAAAERAAVPGVDDVEGQRRVHRRWSGAAPDASFQALKRTPATNSPERPVDVSGSAPAVAGDDVAAVGQTFDLDLQPLDRGIDEAHRAAGRAFLAQHVPGLERLAQLEPHAAVLDRAVEREAELRAAPRTRPDRRRSRRARDRRSTSRKSSQTKCSSMKRSCSAVPQRTGLPSSGVRQNQATSARSNNCCARLMRASGGISNERNSTRPSRPVGPSGENSLSMQISARWVLPVTSTSRLRNRRSTSHGGGGCAIARRRHLRERDFELVEHVLARLVDARRLAGRADEQAGEQIGERRPPLPIEHQALEQIGPAQERAVGGGCCRRARRDCRRRCRYGGRRS